MQPWQLFGTLEYNLKIVSEKLRKFGNCKKKLRNVRKSKDSDYYLADDQGPPKYACFHFQSPLFFWSDFQAHFRPDFEHCGTTDLRERSEEPRYESSFMLKITIEME